MRAAPGLALCVSWAASAVAFAQDPGLDPAHVRLPGSRAGLLEQVRRSPATRGAPQQVDPRALLEEVRAALRSRGRLREAREALLALVTPGPGGIHLQPRDLVQLMDAALESPFPEARETGAVMAGVLFLRSRAAAPASLAGAPGPSGQAQGLAQVLDPSAPRAGPPALDPDLAARINHGPGVAQHMANAIAMNRERRELYAGRTGQASRQVSDTLLAGEESKLVGWTLAALDWMAADFNAQGVPLIREDVIPLRPLPPETPPRWRGRADAATEAAARALLVAYVGDARRLVSARSFEALAARSHQAVVDLAGLEARAGCHFAMSAHLISTVGYGALRAQEHVARARPVRWLLRWRYTGFDVSSAFVSAQYLSSTLYALPDFALEVDLAAQEVHRDHGVGIVVNEFPGGFFRHVWQTRHLRGAPE